MINVYKQKSGFNESTFTGPIHEGKEIIPEEIENDLLQITDEDYQKLVRHELMWQNGELVPNPDYANYAAEVQKVEQRQIYQRELYDIHLWFVENDWKPNKIITGEWNENDPRWLEYKEERAAKRARQDELSELLENM